MIKTRLMLVAAAAAFASTNLHAAAPSAGEAQAAVATASEKVAAPVKEASAQAAAQVASAREQATAATKSLTDKLPTKNILGFIKIEVPNLVQAAKVRRVGIDPLVTSPRTLTYKSRLSRVSRWIGPLTFGLLNYVPFETMNDSVSGAVNNLMAVEKISVEDTVAGAFEKVIKEGKRFTVAADPDADFKLEINRYALDPAPASLGRLKPTVSVTGRLRDGKGRLLWIGKGFSNVFERGIKGATLEQYEADPEMLRKDFAATADVAMRRLAAQANALPKASVKVVPPDAAP